MFTFGNPSGTIHLPYYPQMQASAPTIKGTEDFYDSPFPGGPRTRRN